VTETPPDQSTLQISLCKHTKGGECLGKWIIPLDEATQTPEKKTENIQQEGLPLPAIALKKVFA